MLNSTYNDFIFYASAHLFSGYQCVHNTSLLKVIGSGDFNQKLRKCSVPSLDELISFW
jgi:hypothetical protein